MLNLIRDDLVVIQDFSPYCRDLLHMVQNPRPGEVEEKPGRCHNFFSRPVVNEDNPDSVEDQIILTYCQSIAEAFKEIFDFDAATTANLTGVVYPEGCDMGLHDDMYHNADDPEKREKIHVFSSVHYLNAGYCGGELVFPDLDVTISPKENLMVLFGCHYRHKGNTVKGGIKVSSTKFWRDKNADSAI